MGVLLVLVFVLVSLLLKVASVVVTVFLVVL